MFRVSGPGYIHGDDADEQSLMVEDDARPVDRRSTWSRPPRGKGIRRRVSVDCCRATRE